MPRVRFGGTDFAPFCIMEYEVIPVTDSTDYALIVVAIKCLGRVEYYASAAVERTETYG